MWSRETTAWPTLAIRHFGPFWGDHVEGEVPVHGPRESAAHRAQLVVELRSQAR